MIEIPGAREGLRARKITRSEYERRFGPIPRHHDSDHQKYDTSGVDKRPKRESRPVERYEPPK